MVFKWTTNVDSETTIQTINPDYFKSTDLDLLYILNFILLMLLVAWLADSKFIKELRTPMKLLLASLLVCLELLKLGLLTGLVHLLARVLVLNVGLIKMKVNNWRVLGMMLVGMVVGYFPIALLIYTGVMIILVVYYGRDATDTRGIKLYLVIFYTLLFFNYSYWFEYAIYINDIHPIIIEFCIFISIPIGVFLIPN